MLGEGEAVGKKCYEKQKGLAPESWLISFSQEKHQGWSSLAFAPCWFLQVQREDYC